MSSMQPNTYTGNRIKSAKWLVLVSSILAAATDLLAMILLLAGGYSFLYCLCPLLLLLCDGLFIASVFYSNFRFRYTLWQVLIYVVLVIGGMMATLFVDLTAGQRVVGTDLACALWVCVHIITCVSVCISAVYAARVKPKFNGVLAAICCLALAGVSVTYGVSLVKDGFFGQGVGESRTLEYTYDSATDSYTLSGVLEGRGDTVNVNSTFNGKNVTAVDCNVFTAKGVRNVYMNVPYDIRLTNTQALANTPQNINIYAQKTDYNDFVNRFHAMAKTENIEQIHTFANNFCPQTASEDEVFISFAYPNWAHDTFSGELLYAWFGQKGEAFAFDKYAEEYPYLAHISPTAENYLWCDTNRQGYILAQPQKDGVSLNTLTVQENQKALAVELDKIYHLAVGVDNDELYEYNGVKTTQAGGQTLNYRYVTQRTADALFTELNITRAGFTLAWKKSGTTVTNLSQVLGTTTFVVITPEWTRSKPEVNLTYTVDGAKNGNDAIYGANINFTTTATLAGNPDFSYAWQALGESVSCTEKDYALTTPKPNQSGTYLVTVTASSADSSLISTKSASVSVTIDKKPLEFTWSLPSDTVYSGTDKAIGCELVAGQAVGSDILAFDYDIKSVRNANTYTSRITLDESIADRYSIKQGHASKTVTVTPYEITLQPSMWSAEGFIYNGDMQTPALEALNGLASDGVLPVAVSGATNAGTHTARATLDNGNYKLLNNTFQFTIVPMTVDVSWTNTSFTYNGNAQKPTASATGAKGVALTLTVAGGQTNAGTDYTATASLADTNYSLNTATTQQAFTISPMDVTVDWTNTSLTYNGNAQKPTATAGGAKGATLTLNVGGAQVNAGTDYTATASLKTEHANNYNLIGSATTTFEIVPMTVDVSWTNTSFIYNGNEQKPTASAIGAKGVALALTVTNGAVNVGANYSVTASLQNEADINNYNLTNVTQIYKINPKALTVTVENKNKTFDGLPFSAFTLSVNGLVGNDTAAQVFTLSYANMVDKINAGVYDIMPDKTDGAKAGNYSVTIEKGTLTIAKKQITLTWQAQREFTYDGTAKTIAATTEDMVAGYLEEISFITNKTAKDAGTYTMTASLPTNGNYTIVGGTTCQFTVKAKAIAVIWTETTASVSAGDLCGADTVGILYEYYDGENQKLSGAPTEAGTYTVKAVSNNPNYTLTGNSKQFTIEQEETE